MWGWKAESTNLAPEGIVCKAISFLKLGFGTERRENCALGNSHQGEHNAHRSNLLCTQKPGVKSGGSKVRAVPGICCVLTWGAGAGILGANEGARHCFLTLYPSKGFVVLICARITPANICLSSVCVMSSGLDQDAWHPGEQASAQITYITDWSVFREGLSAMRGSRGSSASPGSPEIQFRLHLQALQAKHGIIHTGPFSSFLLLSKHIPWPKWPHFLPVEPGILYSREKQTTATHINMGAPPEDEYNKQAAGKNIRGGYFICRKPQIRQNQYLLWGYIQMWQKC